MKFAITVLMTSVLLTACVQADSKETRRLIAPDVVRYTQDTLNAVADEMTTCVAPSTMELLKDYCVMRDQARIMRGEKAVCTNE